MSEPETVICTFRVRPGALDELLDLRPHHHGTLRRLELITDRPTHTYVGEESAGPGPVVIDIFEWVDDEASERAHGHPEIAALWERMDALCEPRHGLPSMDFPHFRAVD